MAALFFEASLLQGMELTKRKIKGATTLVTNLISTDYKKDQSLCVITVSHFDSSTWTGEGEIEEAHGGHAIIVMDHYFLQHTADRSKMQAGRKGTLMSHCCNSTSRKPKSFLECAKQGSSQNSSTDGTH